MDYIFRNNMLTVFFISILRCFLRRVSSQTERLVCAFFILRRARNPPERVNNALRVVGVDHPREIASPWRVLPFLISPATCKCGR